MNVWVRRALYIIFALFILAFLAAYVVYNRQGLPDEFWTNFETAKVRKDERGIPTIEAGTWAQVVEAQGYVVASERFFQMDLMRRAASGRLSEWFGEAALGIDKKRRAEDWEGVADRGWQDLPEDERAYIESFTKGVNRFLDEHPWRWGFEYVLLQDRPKPWQGRDSLLILLSMAEQLTAFSDFEANASRWTSLLSEEWSNFVLARDHPWNVPLFGVPDRLGPDLPTDVLNARAMDAFDQTAISRASALMQDTWGSNNWAWCGETGCYLANDPHLGASVPHLWYAVRLRVRDDEWVVGVSIPGLPGVTLGMNPHLAWAFTNVGEDVDDLLLEKVDEEKGTYLASKEGDQEIWKPIEKREHKIEVRGAAPVSFTSRHTHRGPLVQNDALGSDLYSRVWLAYQPKVLRLPVMLNRATNWEELNAAVDGLTIPAQNVVFVDRKGNVGYRASGTGIDRRVDGFMPTTALEGEWKGLLPAETRPRMLFYVRGQPEIPGGKSVTATSARSIATANERIWVDRWDHRWTEDLRKDRIRTVLTSRHDFTRVDMEALQRDTVSRYHLLILEWVRKNADTKKLEEGVEKRLARWAQWTGAAAEDATTFTDAVEVEAMLSAACIDRLRRDRISDKGRVVDYEWSMKSAWIIKMLESEPSVRLFGFDPTELATALANAAEMRTKRRRELYPEINRWAAQHPFVGRVPVLGNLFAVDTPAQRGWRGLVNVEHPKFGASVRLVWDPLESTCRHASLSIL